MSKQHYILWLPSWYPNELEPYHGDFIQRHAKAASWHHPVTVIFFTEYGEKVSSACKIEEQVQGNLKEIIVYVPFKTFFRPLDRIRYNLRFYSFSRKFLKNYFRENGLPSFVHVHVPVKAGNLALWIKRKWSIPFIASEQASTYLEGAGADFFENRHWLYRKQVKKIFSEASVVTNVSNTVRKILIKRFPIKRSAVIYNVVDTGLFHWSAEKENVFTYIHVSSLTQQKNVFGMLRAFKKFFEIRKDWQLIMVGPYTAGIRQFIDEEKLTEHVYLTGEVPYAEVARRMQKSNVFVLFSRHENFPCVIVEALCCGLPVISSDVAGVGEAVNASNGVLVRSEDEDQLVQALGRMRETYHRYDVPQIAADAAGKFGYKTIAEKFDELYRTMS